MKQKLYNIKMRAAQGKDHKKGGKHVSGAERIILEKEIKQTINNLVERAFTHSIGKADFINISIETINEAEIIYLSSLPITTVNVKDYLEGRDFIIKYLESIFLSEQKARAILDILINASPMRGAIIIDIHSLKRLEPIQERGIRVTGMDWDNEILPLLNNTLTKEEINNNHVKEAVALATKVANAPGIVAEICWSDDPDYTAGYIASKNFGYIRLPYLKPKGIDRGGRIFCFDSTQASLEECIKWLENQIIIINKLGPYKGTFTVQNYLKE